ncbi:Ig-specific serine endopeptidase MIP [Mycoplasmopsis glycophila]|uniref:Membrane-associated lipoprotein n=1 Tax=Mycoplasmopsis glycophila TaxID=171285 RepID=A0A449AUM1_9BACT|nr:DUF31 family protein [Mycoplasmopsis glycophila]VEU70207.1 Membrane-associated lipoprotein precursor [Mycoplasmopsis glycophila]
MKKNISWKLLLLSLSSSIPLLAAACAGKTIKSEPEPKNPITEKGGSNNGSSEGGDVVDYPNDPNNGSISFPGFEQDKTNQPSKIPLPNPEISSEYSRLFKFDDLSLNYNNPDQEGLKKYIEYESIYLKELINRLNMAPYVEKYKEYSADFITNFDNKSKETYQPFFRDAFLKNYSIPDPSGSHLVLNPLQHDLKRSYYGSDANDRGKPRYLANELYKNAAIETFEIRFNNQNDIIKNGKKGAFRGQHEQRVYNGTAWILDYVPTNDGSYPTKWYIATNLHVVMPFRRQAGLQGEPYKNLAQSQKEADALREPNIRYNQMIDESNEAMQKMEQLKLKYGENNAEYKKLLNKYTIVDANNPSEWILEYNKVLKAKKEAENNVYGYTQSITLSKFRTNVPIRKELSPNKWDPWIDTVTLRPNQVKIVYAATDFLNQSPSDYLAADDPNANYEEMVDFAILEVDFSKQQPDSFENAIGYSSNLVDGSDNFTKVQNVNQLAEIMTNDYAGTRSSVHSRMANYDVLTEYDNIANQMVEVRDGDKNISVSKMNVNFIAVGFPTSRTDYDLSAKSLKPSQRALLDYTSSLWTNKPRSKDKGVIEYGHSLSKNFAYRNFVNKPGITDLTITSPVFNREKNEPFSVEVFKDPRSTYQGDKYLTYGLGYVLTNWQPMSGSSGSSIRDIDGNILAINFASGDILGNTLINLSQALRSNGYDYQGQYGKYNLEQYDLIYGGGKNQKTSYRQALEKLYGSNFKTNLFKKGTQIIPEAYKFKK